MTFSIVETSDFGARAARHLRPDPVVWLTTVGASGTPAPTRSGSSGPAPRP
jgi:hypothetical protein